jgi:hypothetical protein
MTDTKNPAAVKMGQARWAKTTKKQRDAHAQMMADRRRELMELGRQAEKRGDKLEKE